ncbi:lipopolysaccharide biosynthesis protein [Parafilimonas sp.]|uniref:lipopolysaccharide biosynthesis protein n=1 Tax=Parafilimonas sp. TaxID=1969739 RepID=UPI003F7FEFD1
MSSIKQLAGQTFWYGVSGIAARFINYLLTPYLTYSALISTANYGQMTAMYAAIPLFNAIFTYGMETTYFRFMRKDVDHESVNNTSTISLLISSVVLTIVLWLNQDWLAKATSLAEFPLLVQLSIIVIGLDALATIPFARLRYEGRPRLFALIKIANILINIGFTVFFLSYCPAKAKADPNSWAIIIYRPDLNPITYVLVANALASLCTLFLLGKWILPKRWSFNTALWLSMMAYSLPMLVANLGGTVNETFDRLMLGWWLPNANGYADEQRGIYGACYKLSILITLFIQAFRMGAEPFFFKQAESDNPQKTYARVTKFFVITVAVMFLGVTLFLPVWRYFIDEKYWGGLRVVPILLLANMSLGIYYNLSIWYKLTNKTMAGAAITLIGTAITIVINYFFIPKYSYVASAWATFLCYASMMVISFIWGQKEYYVPYAWKKLLAYIIISVLIFFLHNVITGFYDNIIFSLTIAVLFILAFIFFIIKIEKKEFVQFPFIGGLVKKYF